MFLLQLYLLIIIMKNKTIKNIKLEKNIIKIYTYQLIPTMNKMHLSIIHSSMNKCINYLKKFKLNRIILINLNLLLQKILLLHLLYIHIHFEYFLLYRTQHL
jgi:hypothetical protein